MTLNYQGAELSLEKGASHFWKKCWIQKGDKANTKRDLQRSKTTTKERVRNDLKLLGSVMLLVSKAEKDTEHQYRNWMRLEFSTHHFQDPAWNILNDSWITKIWKPDGDEVIEWTILMLDLWGFFYPVSWKLRHKKGIHLFWKNPGVSGIHTLKKGIVLWYGFSTSHYHIF